MERGRNGRYKIGEFGHGTKSTRNLHNGLTPYVRRMIDGIMEVDQIASLTEFAGVFNMPSSSPSRLRYGDKGPVTQEEAYKKLSPYLRGRDPLGWGRVIIEGTLEKASWRLQTAVRRNIRRFRR